MFVDGEAWDRAALRFEDLAEQLSQLVTVSHENDSTVRSDDIGAARQWAITCRRMTFRKSKFARTKFDDYLRLLHGTIDAFCGPFVVE
ncbi:MAG: hypothetical protein WD875_11140 [Pirellulales bacterium]